MHKLMCGCGVALQGACTCMYMYIVYVQYASIKSLRSTIVKRSFYGASVCVSFQTQRCENGNGTEQSQERNGAKTVCKTVINYARKLSNALDREIG